jgi:hypothetical protein
VLKQTRVGLNRWMWERPGSGQAGERCGNLAYAAGPSVVPRIEIDDVTACRLPKLGAAHSDEGFAWIEQTHRVLRAYVTRMDS